MRKYEVIEDLQGADFMLHEVKTFEEWKEWLLKTTDDTLDNLMHYEGNDTCENYELYKKVKSLKDNEIIAYIEKTYEIVLREAI